MSSRLAITGRAFVSASAADIEADRRRRFVQAQLLQRAAAQHDRREPTEPLSSSIQNTPVCAFDAHEYRYASAARFALRAHDALAPAVAGALIRMRRRSARLSVIMRPSNARGRCAVQMRRLGRQQCADIERADHLARLCARQCACARHTFGNQRGRRAYESRWIAIGRAADRAPQTPASPN